MKELVSGIKREDDFKKVLSINPNYADALNYFRLYMD